MSDQKALKQIIELYNTFNIFYYDKQCVPENEKLQLNFKLLGKDPGHREGHTTFTFNEKENAAEITIQIKRELAQGKKSLHLCAVILHEMVHAYLFANNIFELNEDKTEAIHGDKFHEIAKTHGLQDGLIMPDEIISYLFG